MPRVFAPLPQTSGPHARYISTYRTPPLILSVVPGWLAGASGHRLSSRRGRHVLCGMRAPCACVHQSTIVQGCRAFCDILATNVGITRKSCRTPSASGGSHVAWGTRVGWQERGEGEDQGMACEEPSASRTLVRGGPHEGESHGSTQRLVQAHNAPPSGTGSV